LPVDKSYCSNKPGAPTVYREIYLLIAIFAIGEQKSVLAKQRRIFNH